MYKETNKNMSSKHAYIKVKADSDTDVFHSQSGCSSGYRTFFKQQLGDKIFKLLSINSVTKKMQPQRDPDKYS